jgi:O-antigen/teichoic acid export membrane protein
VGPVKPGLGLRESLAVAVVFAMAGVAAAGVNLLLAGIMTVEDFGLISLVQAVVVFGTPLVSLGAADALQRLAGRRGPRRPVAWPRLFRSVAVRWTVPTGAFLSLAAGLWYGWTPAVTLGTAVFMVAAGVAYLAGHILRAGGETTWGMVTVHGWRFASAALVLAFLVAAPARLSATAAVLLLAVSAALAVPAAALRIRRRLPGDGPLGEMWPEFRTESRLFLTITLSVTGLAHADKLLIPLVLSLDALALYSVVGWLVITPYLLVQGANTFTLVPRLRRVERSREGWELLWKYAALTAAVAIVAAIMVLTVTPTILTRLYGDRYIADSLLLLALACLGTVRMFYALPSAAISAWADRTVLASFRSWGWVSLAVAVTGVLMGGLLLGLYAVPLGLAAGTLVRLGAAFVLARRIVLREAVGAAAPGAGVPGASL